MVIDSYFDVHYGKCNEEDEHGTGCVVVQATVREQATFFKYIDRDSRIRAAQLGHPGIDPAHSRELSLACILSDGQ